METNSKARYLLAITLYPYQLLNYVDRRVSKNLSEAGIETRPVKSNGLWCCSLLPIILLTNTMLYDVSPLYSLTAFVSLGLLCQSMLLLIFMSISDTALKESSSSGCVASTLISTQLIYAILQQDLLVSLGIATTAIIAHTFLFSYLLKNFPKTFTVGEASIVVQGVVCFLAMSLAKLIMTHERLSGDYDLVNTIIYVALITVALIIACLNVVNKSLRNIVTFGYIVGTVLIGMLCVVHVLLGPTCVFDFLSYVFLNGVRLKIFLFWLCLLTSAVLLVYYRTESGKKADTVVRKSFHVLISLVFLPGILFDSEFMMLAAAVAFALFVFVEAIRILEVEPFAPYLNSAFEVYCDEKDMGGFALTPLYLMVGVWAPLPLAGGPGALAGVLAVGAGDAAASAVGASGGRHQWPGTSKTLEGTIANIASQIILVYLLVVTGLLQGQNVILRASIAAVTSSLVEAKTVQVDNLVLPLVSVLSFQMTCFLGPDS